MVPDSRRDQVGLDLKLAAVPRVTHESERVCEEAGNAVLEREQIHDLGVFSAGDGSSTEGMVDFKPHHDREIDVLITDARAEDWNLDSLGQP